MYAHQAASYMPPPPPHYYGPVAAAAAAVGQSPHAYYPPGVSGLGWPLTEQQQQQPPPHHYLPQHHAAHRDVARSTSPLRQPLPLHGGLQHPPHMLVEPSWRGAVHHAVDEVGSLRRIRGHVDALLGPLGPPPPSAAERYGAPDLVHIATPRRSACCEKLDKQVATLEAETEEQLEDVSAVLCEERYEDRRGRAFAVAQRLGLAGLFATGVPPPSAAADAPTGGEGATGADAGDAEVAAADEPVGGGEEDAAAAADTAASATEVDKEEEGEGGGGEEEEQEGGAAPTAAGGGEGEEEEEVEVAAAAGEAAAEAGEKAEGGGVPEDAAAGGETPAAEEGAPAADAPGDVVAGAGEEGEEGAGAAGDDA